MSEDFDAFVELERVSAILGLVVNQAGGAIEITADEIAKGLPESAGVRVILNDGGDLTLRLVESGEPDESGPHPVPER